MRGGGGRGGRGGGSAGSVRGGGFGAGGGRGIWLIPARHCRGGEWVRLSFDALFGFGCRFRFRFGVAGMWCVGREEECIG